jgi:hypothetical protein
MVKNSEALDTVRRIARLLRGLDQANRPPNRREAYHIRAAIEALEMGRYGEAATSSRQAERSDPIPPRFANLLATNEPVGVHELRKELQRVMAAQ